MFRALLGPRLTIVELALAFTVGSFLFSLAGFLHPEQVVRYNEYSAPTLFVELLGHFFFGLLASLPLLDLDLSLLVGSVAVLIDVDHLLATLGFAVDGRLGHSAAYAAVASVLLYFLALRAGFSRRRAREAAFAGPIAILSHIAYDVFSAAYVQPGSGSEFPIFAPVSFQSVELVGLSWLMLEVVAVAMSAVACLSSRGSMRNRAALRPSKGFTLQGRQQGLGLHWFMRTPIRTHGIHGGPPLRPG